MELEKKSKKFEPRIQHAFFVLGIDIFRRTPKTRLQHLNRKRSPKFWQRDDLQFVLVDAKKAYLKAIKQSHPDKGGSTEDTIEINKAWEFIERRFAIKGFKLN